MARRKKVEEKNYDELIKASEECIASLTADLKTEKANLKQLKRDKAHYDEMIRSQKKEQEIHEVAELFLASGKSLDDIKKLLQK